MTGEELLITLFSKEDFELIKEVAFSAGYTNLTDFVRDSIYAMNSHPN